MRVPHTRVLQTLADAGQPLTLSQITTAAGYNEGSGTASRALYGVPEGSSSGPEQTGLLALGYVHDEQIQGAGDSYSPELPPARINRKRSSPALATRRLPPGRQITSLRWENGLARGSL
jgi:hypothetical protein